MANDNITNSDVKVLGNKIDNLTTQVSSFITKQDACNIENQKRLMMAEKQLLLAEQTHITIYKDIENNVKPNIEKLDKRQRANDILTKIITGFQGLLTLALIYLGIRK